MAHGLKYTVTFKNRINDIYRAEIWEKDYVGESSELTGAETPFTAAYQSSDDDLFNPIKALEINLSFITNTISLVDFYSEDDEKYRIDFYCQELADSTSVEQLLYTTYIILDGSSEAVTDRKHVITLKATDNLGLLKEVTLDKSFASLFAHKQILYDLVNYCLSQTGLYSWNSTIDMSLHLRIYDNLFENTTDDRTIDDTNDPFRETAVHSGMFQNSDGTWKNCYDVLSIILKNKNACIFQAEGFWNIIRIPEYKLFTDGQIPGTDYNYNGATTDTTAVTLDPLIDIDRNGTIYPVNEDQLSSIQRPLKYVLNTFNYQQPESLIINNDLQLPDGATPYATSTVGDFRYDKYDLATYFTHWKQTHSDTSYLEVVTDASVSPEGESGRYIVTPGAVNEQRGVEFNPIEVTARDTFDFTLRFRTEPDTDDTLRFWIRFDLITAGDQYYTLTNIPGAGSSINVHWTGPNDVAFYDDPLGMYLELTTPDDIDTTEYIQWNLQSMVETGGKLPLIPEDGILLIEVRGTNGSDSSNRQTTYWKDIKLDFFNYINDSTQIIGQTHTDEQDKTIKNNLEQEIELDDSPRNTIAGTLFTDAITDFEADIGNILFTKTTLWHRGETDEALRLGNILTQERLLAQLTARTVIEGTFKNLHYYTYEELKFVSMLTLFNIGFYTENRRFIFSIVTFDYMANFFNGKLIEIFKDGEVIGGELNTNADITNYAGTATSLPLVFDDIVTAVNFSTDGSFIIYTYDGTETITRQIALNLGGTWNVADAVTIHLKVNGVVVGSYGITMGAFTALIEFETTLSTGDTVSASIDWVGAIAYDVDIDSGSLEVTSITEDYTFKYLYETN